MATKDISRYLHQPRKHYEAVRLQQGRVLLDYAFNEGARLPQEDQRRALLAAIGPQGSPDNGFSLGAPSALGTSLPAPGAPLVLGDVAHYENIQLNGVSTTV